jgi:hypothetical protein
MRLSSADAERELDMSTMRYGQQEVSQGDRDGYDRSLRELDSLEPGALIRVRYLDHVLQRNVEPEKAQPIIREAIGRLERQNEEYVYLVVDEYMETRNDPVSLRKTTGFVILKSTIREIKIL